VGAADVYTRRLEEARKLAQRQNVPGLPPSARRPER
jgi:hypothetical protein